MFKLIRDKIPDIFKEAGQVCNYAEVKNDELFLEVLRAKLIEEVNEFWAANNIEELVDIRLVVEALAEAFGYSKEKFDEAYNTKLNMNGGFNNKYIIFLPDQVKETQKEQSTE